MAISDFVRTNHVITATCDSWWDVRDLLRNPCMTGISVHYNGNGWDVSIVLDKEERDNYNHLIPCQSDDIA